MFRVKVHMDLYTRQRVLRAAKAAVVPAALAALIASVIASAIMAAIS